jgi:hypothetical protein
MNVTLSRMLVLLVLLLGPLLARGAAIIVAPADAGTALKQKANFVCDGVADEVELLASITRQAASSVTLNRADNGADQTFTCIARHSVEWLPGQYHLSAPLVIPAASDLNISAEGTELIYAPATGTAVILRGMNRCRYRLGAIRSASADAALAVSPLVTMPAMGSSLSFSGLLGTGSAQVGLLVDATKSSVVNNQLGGTNIRGFAQGVCLRATGGLCEANWLNFADIRDCDVGLVEGDDGLRANDYSVHLQLNRPGATGIRSGGQDGKWQIFVNPRSFPADTTAQATLVLTFGAQHNMYELLPPPRQLPRLLNYSLHPNSILLSTDRAPYRLTP